LCIASLCKDAPFRKIVWFSSGFLFNKQYNQKMVNHKAIKQAKLLFKGEKQEVLDKKKVPRKELHIN
jgi:hypothetical protein